MATQPERRNANEHARNHPDENAKRNAKPRRDAELYERDRHSVGAEPEERRVAKRDHAAVARQHVPAETHRGPDQHQRHHELVVGISHHEADYEIDDREERDHRILPHECALFTRHQVRSQTRPNIPCGRKKMMIRKTTKIAVFCS